MNNNDLSKDAAEAASNQWFVGQQGLQEWVETRLAAYEKRIVDHLNMTIGAFQVGGLRQYNLFLKQFKDYKEEAERSIKTAIENAVASAASRGFEVSDDQILNAISKRLGCEKSKTPTRNKQAAYTNAVLQLEVADVITSENLIRKLLAAKIHTVADILKHSSTDLIKLAHITCVQIRSLRIDLKAIGVEFKYSTGQAENRWCMEHKNERK
jgi:hypothetical protein